MALFCEKFQYASRWFLDQLQARRVVRERDVLDGDALALIDGGKRAVITLRLAHKPISLVQ